MLKWDVEHNSIVVNFSRCLSLVKHTYRWINSKLLIITIMVWVDKEWFIWMPEEAGITLVENYKLF